MAEYIIFNDKFYKTTENVISFNNHSLKYGDGLFETMKVEYFVVHLGMYHFERLFKGMKVLGIYPPAYFIPEFIETMIRELLDRNDHKGIARVRLTVFRDAADQYFVSESFNYILQSFPLDHFDDLNDKGLTLGVYDEVRKSPDILSNIKINSFLPYLMAARYAKLNDLSDCLLLNTHGRVCDTVIANIFIIKDGIIYTPSLEEGCIAGVMRRHIFQKLKAHHTIIETEINLEELMEADEIFLSNAIRGIRWVEKFEGRKYKCEMVAKIWDRVFG
jgi:branched-chain amino acid aminotransferase